MRQGVDPAEGDGKEGRREAGGERWNECEA